MKKSCGILLFRLVGDSLEVLLVHPGGPFWKDKHVGAWTVPKGLPNEGEDLLAAAIWEFAEETGTQPLPPYYSLGSVVQKGGKKVFCWGAAGDLNAAGIISNIVQMAWPPKSGKYITVPEINEARWFSLTEAELYINPAQTIFLKALQLVVKKL